MSEWQRWKGIMKACPFEERRLAKWQPPYIVQPKYDGVRCRAIPIKTGGYLLLSSEENPIFSVPHINKALESLSLGIELDGELYCHGMSFQDILSITSRTVNFHPDYRNIEYHIFDLAQENKPQMARIIDLDIIQLSHPLIKAPFWLCYSLEDIMRVYDKLINMDYEGIIVRYLYALYVRKRSVWVMKFKPKKEDNYAIIGCSQEISIENVAKNSLGSFICKSGDGDTFSVGTGFSKDTRRELWKKREELPGKICKVQYQHLTSGKKVPRFPVFVEVIEE